MVHHRQAQQEGYLTPSVDIHIVMFTSYFDCTYWTNAKRYKSVVI